MLRRSSIAAYTLLTVSLAVSGACSSPEPDLPPLSSVAVANSGQSPDLVRAVHLFAAQHPEVLNYVPCFCGCQRQGHKHNDDCFVAGRDSTGKVTAWELHGVG